MSRILKRREDTPSEKRALWRDASNAFTLGWNLAIPIFGGVLIGYLLDKGLGTLPIFTIGCMLLGIAAGFYNYFRTVNRLETKDTPRIDKKDGRDSKK